LFDKKDISSKNIWNVISSCCIRVSFRLPPTPRALPLGPLVPDSPLFSLVNGENGLSGENVGKRWENVGKRWEKVGKRWENVVKRWENVGQRWGKGGEKVGTHANPTVASCRTGCHTVASCRTGCHTVASCRTGCHTVASCRTGCHTVAGSRKTCKAHFHLFKEADITISCM